MADIRRALALTAVVTVATVVAPASARAAPGPSPKVKAFCSVLAPYTNDIELLGASTAVAKGPDAAAISRAIGRAVEGAPAKVKAAGKKVARAYRSIATSGNTAAFSSSAVMAAAAKLFAYFTKRCATGSGAGASQEQINLTLSGALTAQLTMPDSANECTVAKSTATLTCKLSPQGAPYGIALAIAPFTGPATYSATAVVLGGRSVQVFQFDENRGLAAKFDATGGQVVISRGDPSAGPIVASNAGVAGSIDADATLGYLENGYSVAGQTVHVSGTFAAPVSGG